MNRVIIVLGSPNDNLGNLSDIALSRCQAAFEQYQQWPDSKLLLTGGFGEHFNQTNTAHALYCQAYLIDRGISKSAFTNIALSRFTFEDATLSKPIIEEHGFDELCLVTSEFHLPRAKLIFSGLFPNLSFHYVATKTPVSESQLQQLIQHELSVMDRERENLAKI
ncbi:YdcF family protein [uncultured Shewanella sp.]|uniref:YdcF family protein n=1 Tax=uncultured Shewanella sp. TaxID=173975 RepID=UPI002625F560|nr:YdcF family protein [uncultured Shewanella sp.]